MSSPDRLVYMANQIGKFFASQGRDKAVPGIADHIRKFWDPRMRAASRRAMPATIPIAVPPPMRPAVRQAVRFPIRLPVRPTIHSSVVSTTLAKSSLVTISSGR